jgi:hypothetical protein
MCVSLKKGTESKRYKQNCYQLVSETKNDSLTFDDPVKSGVKNTGFGQSTFTYL